MVKTVLFDVGGVVVFFDYNRMADNLAAHSDADFERVKAAAFGSQGQKYMEGLIGTDEFVPWMMEEIGFQGDRRSFEDVFTTGFNPNPPLETIVADVKPKVRQIATVTNTNPLWYKECQTRFASLFERFDRQITSYDTRSLKPSLFIYGAALDATKSQPEDVVLIDDKAENVAAFKRLDGHGIVYESPDQLRAELEKLGVRL